MKESRLFKFLLWYAPALSAAAGTSPELLDAVQAVESSGNMFAVSSEGCLGLYQICPRYTPLPRWALFVPVFARAESARHLQGWRKRAKGDTMAALAAYNCGNAGLRGECGRGYAKLVLSKMRRNK